MKVCDFITNSCAPSAVLLDVGLMICRVTWCPGDKFDTLPRGYEQSDFQQYQYLRTSALKVKCRILDSSPGYRSDYQFSRSLNLETGLLISFGNQFWVLFEGVGVLVVRSAAFGSWFDDGSSLPIQTFQRLSVTLSKYPIKRTRASTLLGGWQTQRPLENLV